jgi:hypothetical protein
MRNAAMMSKGENRDDGQILAPPPNGDIRPLIGPSLRIYEASIHRHDRFDVSSCASRDAGCPGRLAASALARANCPRKFHMRRRDVAKRERLSDHRQVGWIESRVCRCQAANIGNTAFATTCSQPTIRERLVKVDPNNAGWQRDRQTPRSRPRSLAYGRLRWMPFGGASTIS